MESAKLDVNDRSDRGTSAARRLRKTGQFPVNLYGLGRDPRAMQASSHSFERILDGGFHIVELQQSDKKQVVLIKDVQFDALGSTILHADLLRIDRDKKVQVHVPVRYIGMAPEVTDSIVEKLLDTIQVEVLPMAIPQQFVINLSKVEVGMAIRVGEIEMPEGCAAYEHNDSDMVVLNHVKVQVEAEESEDGDSVEPEVIGKKADDGDEG